MDTHTGTIIHFPAPNGDSELGGRKRDAGACGNGSGGHGSSYARRARKHGGGYIYIYIWVRLSRP